MKEYIGQVCKINILRDGRNLFYEANVSEVTSTHISFRDKYDVPYTFRIQDIVEIKGNS